jgi:thiamine biosynthesis protein ThiS
MPQITVNGQPREIPPNTTISQLIALSNLTPDKVAVELNRRLVRTPAYDTILKDNDEIELVTFVGGG